MKESSKQSTRSQAAYKRWGDPMVRFWSKVRRNGPNECWNWTGGRFAEGYGIFHYNGKTQHAQRFAWLFSNGEFDQTLHVCHKCDNPSCCNPDHLFLGRAVDNVRDCIKKGRWKGPPRPTGEKHPGHILNEEQVLSIRKIYSEGLTTQLAIAKKFGVSESAVANIIQRTRWKHI